MFSFYKKLYNLRIPSSIKNAMKLNGGKNNLLMLVGLGAVIGAGAWYLSNKGKEAEKAMNGNAYAYGHDKNKGPFLDRDDPPFGNAYGHDKNKGPFGIYGNSAFGLGHNEDRRGVPRGGHISNAFLAGDYGLYPVPKGTPVLTQPDNQLAVVKKPMLGARGFNDFTMNDNSIPTPFVEVNFPYTPYTANNSRLPPPLANTIDKNAYVVTYTGWRD